MVFVTNMRGERMCVRPRSRECRMQASQLGVGRFGIPQTGDGRDGRVTVDRLVMEAALAAFRGNPVIVGYNSGPGGIGSATRYEPTELNVGTMSPHIGVSRYDNGSASISTIFHTMDALRLELGRALRRDDFRVVGFADHLADRNYSRINRFNIDYGAGDRSNVVPPVGQLACRY